ncbi:diacylglycerol kinase family protein [Tetragenococcus halophilus]|uniref:Undecaprenol kinase n=3 Tax=Tetragenococcus halophilus TaxID=51669 RepID=A0A2H6DMY0_TETHA|nr:diacylglycerol kinase family protein [Tetragenococcus halophilus]AOF49079.1 UDP kinase [Tetragenococcus halophilus]MCF1602515.1 diacylglycerol kinase family protein [Tetragenococcus halophilus]MCO8283625.1 diacylglycerol kinase family protein [Tetragenococcus halophilus]MCO8286183.1 diacylglycerol kinase family protein [Tetragenococcus halophilus]MCO8292783.1 diacylglycerol kinase family protein [Tetragenococcus halophilus]
MPMDSNDKKPSVGKSKNLLNSIEFAISGIKTAYKDERNMRIHMFCAVLVIILGLVLDLDRFEWLWIGLCIFLMLIMEIINTIFENVVNMVTNHHFHPLGKKVKDVAAAAVLITAIFSVFVGALIFLPKIYQIMIH